MSRLDPFLLLAACFLTVLADDTAGKDVVSDEPPVAGFFPKEAPAIVAIILYGISAIIQWTNFFVIPPVRRPYMLVLTLGMTAMTVGFILRALYIQKPYSVGAFVAMDLFILLSPCLFLATDYTILSHLAATFDKKVTQSCFLIRHSLIVRIFVWSDVTTFILQGTGGSLTTTNDSHLVNLGSTLTMIGLILQAISFLIFTIILLVFGLRVSKRFPEVWNPQDPRPFKAVSRKPIDDWRILYYVMCATCGGILVRSIFRITEFAGGYSGTIVLHEVYFYVFDALPLWISMSLYCVAWPVRAFVVHPEGHELNIHLNDRM
ncbi:RTA1 like protein-domain-containing protein [Mycena haematopus]|nr:RTA1 like protein-domain-containing protein [Mycena haematopus]